MKSLELRSLTLFKVRATLRELYEFHFGNETDVGEWPHGFLKSKDGMYDLLSILNAATPAWLYLHIRIIFEK